MVAAVGRVQVAAARVGAAKAPVGTTAKAMVEGEEWKGCGEWAGLVGGGGWLGVRRGRGGGSWAGTVQGCGGRRWGGKAGLIRCSAPPAGLALKPAPGQGGVRPSLAVGGGRGCGGRSCGSDWVVERGACKKGGGRGRRPASPPLSGGLPPASAPFFTRWAGAPPARRGSKGGVWHGLRGGGGLCGGCKPTVPRGGPHPRGCSRPLPPPLGRVQGRPSTPTPPRGRPFAATATAAARRHWRRRPRADAWAGRSGQMRVDSLRSARAVGPHFESARCKYSAAQTPGLPP